MEGHRGGSNIVEANDQNYKEIISRSKKVVAVLYASHCEHSRQALVALCGVAVMHNEMLFVKVEVRDMDDPPDKIKAQKIHDDAGIKRYPTFVAYENYIMKGTMVSEKSTPKEQFEAFEKFISDNFSQQAA